MYDIKEIAWIELFSMQIKNKMIILQSIDEPRKKSLVYIDCSFENIFVISKFDSKINYFSI